MDFAKINFSQNSKYTNSPWLINYWPFNSHIQDIIGGCHLYNGYKANLISDRFGRPLSALSLNTGFYKMPSINYFPTGEFTLTAWIYLRGCNSLSRLFEFFNGVLNESIRLIICNQSNNTRFAYNNGSNLVAYLDTPLLPFNKWHHVAFTLSNNSMSTYYNGVLNGTAIAPQKLINLTRLFNFIGRGSNFAGGEPDFNGIIDELKIFKKALNQKEIQYEMIN